MTVMQVSTPLALGTETQGECHSLLFLCPLDGELCSFRDDWSLGSHFTDQDCAFNS